MFSKRSAITESDKKFYELAHKLDKIILQNSENLLILNNQSLHLARKHYYYLDAWRPVIYKTSVSKIDFLKIILNLLESTLYNIKLVTLEFFKKRKSNVGRFSLKRGVDLLIVSHLVGAASKNEDFYYGSLMSNLINVEIDVVRLLIPQSGNRYDLRKSNIFESIVLDYTLSKSQILKYIYSNMIAILNIMRIGVMHKLTPYEILVVLSGQMKNFHNFKLSLNIESSITQMSPKRLVMTFEGNAIERSIFFLCHKYGVKVFGYQHAPIIQNQYSIFRSLGHKLDPDVILTSGPYSKGLFKQQLGFDKEIQVLGSSKNANVKHNLNSILANKTSKVLLVPDGNLTSVSSFLELGKFLSVNFHDFHIVIRAHPLYNEYLSEKMSKIINSNNFKYSNNDLEKDLSDSKWVVYENSSAAIQAGFFGCILIYYNNAFSDVDPLFDLAVNKFIVNSPEEVSEIVQNESNLTLETIEETFEFSNNYFAPLELSSLL